MRRAVTAILFALLCLPGRASAWETVGLSSLMTNDAFATIFDDRWRSASWALGLVRAQRWTGALPARPGAVLEFRFRGEIIAPSNLQRPDPRDRPYAQSLSFGLHSYQAWRGVDTRIGADLVVTGPQVGLSTLQAAIHDVIRAPGPEPALPGQIGNGLHLMASAEAGRRLDLSPRLSARPFIELQAGVETLARAGVDLRFGVASTEPLLLRDVVTGLRSPARRELSPGWTAVFGGDIAYVHDSIFLPTQSAAVATPLRGRLRTGLHWQGRRFGAFYGLTYLGREFEAQRRGQLLGSVRLDIAF